MIIKKNEKKMKKKKKKKVFIAGFELGTLWWLAVTLTTRLRYEYEKLRDWWCYE